MNNDASTVTVVYYKTVEGPSQKFSFYYFDLFFIDNKFFISFNFNWFLKKKYFVELLRL